MRDIGESASIKMPLPYIFVVVSLGAARACMRLDPLSGQFMVAHAGVSRLDPLSGQFMVAHAGE